MARWSIIFSGIIIIVFIAGLNFYHSPSDSGDPLPGPEERNSLTALNQKNSPRTDQPHFPEHVIKNQTIREVSAYNTGDINQGSGDPCISANGDDICEALEKGHDRCAANFVPFGTKLLIESLDTSWRYQCVVVDRMNKRYHNRVDIAMKKEEKPRALNFGLQKLKVTILEEKAGPSSPLKP